MKIEYTIELDLEDVIHEAVSEGKLDDLLTFCVDEGYIGDDNIEEMLAKKSSQEIVKILDDQYRFDLREIYQLIGEELKKRGEL